MQQEKTHCRLCGRLSVQRSQGCEVFSPRCVLPAAWVELGWILGHVLFSLFGLIRHHIYIYIDR